MSIFILALLIFTLPTTVRNAAGKFSFLLMVQTFSSIYHTREKRHLDFAMFSMRRFHCADTALAVFV